MPAYKLTAIFSYVSGAPTDPSAQRTGGWSESVYSNALGPATIRSYLTFLETRAALLCSSAKITAYRTQLVDPSAAAQSSTVLYPGRQDPLWATDVPQAGLLFGVRDTTGTHTRRMRLAGVPDPQITRGEFLPVGGYANDLVQYFTQLGGWLMRTADFTQPKQPINTISAAGVVTTVGAPTVAVGDVVKILRAVATDGSTVSGQFRVAAVTAGVSFTVANWEAGECVKGQVQKFVPIYPIITTTPNPSVRVTIRKVGRPSGGYRGRRSRKRR